MTDSTFKGLPVLFCTEGSPSYNKGVRPGDTILFANGHKIDSMAAYIEARSTNNTELDLIIQRGNQILEMKLDLLQKTE